MFRAASGTATNLEDGRGRPPRDGPGSSAGGPLEFAIHHPHQQLIGRRELALQPVQEAPVRRGEDHVAVLLDRLEDLLGDALWTNRTALEEGDQLAHFRVLAI